MSKVGTRYDKQIVRWFVKDEYTLKQIGDRIGLTKEGVRLRLKNLGIAGRDGGGLARQARARREKAKREKAQAAAFLKRRGMTPEAYKEMQLHRHRDKPPSHWYRELKKSAAQHFPHVPFKIRVGDWWRIWERSGRWNERGLRRGQYCLCRRDYAKGFTVNNLFIEEASRNAARSIAGKFKRKSRKRNRVARG